MTVGVATGGDDSCAIDKAFLLFNKFNCDVAFVATRKRADSSSCVTLWKQTEAGKIHWVYVQRTNAPSKDPDVENAINSKQAGIEWSVTGSGVLAFDWKVSSEADWDVLRFYEVGAGATNEISGTTGGWSRVCATICSAPDVVHTFRWEYEKDPVGDYVGQDCGWVDAISWSPFYPLTVNGGNGGGAHTNGTVVAITADAPPQWQMFNRWTGDTNGVADVLAVTTTLVMPATGIVVTATYKPIFYALAVGSGSGGGPYAYGSAVEIGAEPYEGKRFYRWTGDVDTVADIASATTTVVTVGRTLSVAATYSTPLKVNEGSGSGWHPDGSTATVAADPDPLYKEFAVWTGDATGFLVDPAWSPTTGLLRSRPSCLAAARSRSGGGCRVRATRIT